MSAICVKEMPTLWPPADFQVGFRSDTETALKTVPSPLDSGALRFDAEGCLEVLLVGGPGALGYSWERFDPSNYTHLLEANKFSRYGRGHSRGHAHGVDSLATIAYTIWPTLFGRKATMQDEIDTYYRKSDGRWWVYELVEQYNKLAGESVLPPAPPVTNPTQPTQPTNPPVKPDTPATPVTPVTPVATDNSEHTISLLRAEIVALKEELVTTKSALVEASKPKLATIHPPFVKATIDSLMQANLPARTRQRVDRLKRYLFP